MHSIFIHIVQIPFFSAALCIYAISFCLVPFFVSIFVCVVLSSNIKSSTFSSYALNLYYRNDKMQKQKTVLLPITK